jgi:chromosome segregation ATPase
MEPRPRTSLFGRYFNAASAWVSSSFFVTRDFLKRELVTVKNQLFGFHSHINELQATTTRTQLNVNALITAQKEHRKVAETRFENILQRVRDTTADAQRLKDQQIAFNEEFKQLHTTTIASQNSVAQECKKLSDLKKDVADHKKESEELASALHHNLEADKKIIQLQLNQISQQTTQTCALVRVLGEKVKKFEQLIQKTEEESRDLTKERNKNSGKLEKLEAQIQENRDKTLTLCKALAGFEDSYYQKMGKPKPILQHMEDVD